MPRMITCPGCHQRKAHHARGFCQVCYMRNREFSRTPLPQCSEPGCEARIPHGGLKVCMGHLLDSVGISFRQFDYWTRQGYLKPETGAPGSGHPRRWPEAELEVARRMGVLTQAGVTAERAHAYARGGWPDGEIAPGVRLVIAP